MFIYPHGHGAKVISLKLKQIQVFLVKSNDSKDYAKAMHITPTPQSSHTFQHNLSVSNDSKKHIISTGGQRQIIGIEIYKAYVHRNIFNDREFEYRLTLNTEEQWRLLQSNRSRIFIPKSKTKPRTEREVVHYEHLDLMGLVSLYLKYTTGKS